MVTLTKGHLIADQEDHLQAVAEHGRQGVMVSRHSNGGVSLFVREDGNAAAYVHLDKDLAEALALVLVGAGSLDG